MESRLGDGQACKKILLYKPDIGQSENKPSQNLFKFINASGPLPKRSWIVTTLTASFIIFGVVFFLGWVVLPHFLRAQILNRLAISPEINLELYSAWKSSPVPVYLKVYLFQVENPSNVEAGELPKFLETGPYVFKESRTKIDVSHEDASDSVTYKEVITYQFEQGLSANLSLSDQVTVLNVPFVAAAIKLDELSWPLNDIGHTLLASSKEPLFVRRTVGEALFDGWTVPFLEKLETQVGLSLTPGNKFGFFIGQNSTGQGPYTVSRGIRDKSSFGRVLKFQNKSTLTAWGDLSSSCNQIRGTDGTLFSPFINQETVLTLFNAELCRSIDLTYEKDIVFNAVEGYRFTAPVSVLSDPRESKENRCYCPDLDTNPEECGKQGTLYLGPCRDGAPVALSNPHFLDANQEYINASGLTPSRGKHETFMMIEPLTGLVLNASKKIQINVVMKPVASFSKLRRLPAMLFPLVWADECAEMDELHVTKLRNLLSLIKLLESGLKVALCLIAAAIVIFVMTRNIQCKYGTASGSIR